MKLITKGSIIERIMDLIQSNNKTLHGEISRIILTEREYEEYKAYLKNYTGSIYKGKDGITTNEIRFNGIIIAVEDEK